MVPRVRLRGLTSRWKGSRAQVRIGVLVATGIKCSQVAEVAAETAMAVDNSRTNRTAEMAEVAEAETITRTATIIVPSISTDRWAAGE